MIHQRRHAYLLKSNFSTLLLFKTFNVNKFLYNLNVKAFLQRNSLLPCNWEGSDFVDKDYQHIVAGDCES